MRDFSVTCEAVHIRVHSNCNSGADAEIPGDDHRKGRERIERDLENINRGGQSKEGLCCQFC